MTNSDKQPSPNVLRLKRLHLSWGERHSKEAEVVVIDNEPLIKLYPSKGKPEIISFERLQFLASDILTTWREDGTSLLQKVFEERARLGQKAILETWSELGYTTPEFAKDNKANRTLLLGTMMPTLKNPSRARGPKVSYRAVLKFTTKGTNAYWALTIKEDGTILSSADWNDYEAIKDLAKSCVDKEYVGSFFGLSHPGRSSALIETKRKEDLNTISERIAKRYFVDAIFSAERKGSLSRLVDAYQSELAKVCFAEQKNEVKPSGPATVTKNGITQILHFTPAHDAVPAKPFIRTSGLYLKRRKDIIEMRFVLGIANDYEQYDKRSKRFDQSVRAQEKVLWTKFKKDLKSLGFTLTEDSLPEALTLLRTQGIRMKSFHYFRVFCNVQKHHEAVLHNSTDEELYLYAKEHSAQNELLKLNQSLTRVR